MTSKTSSSLQSLPNPLTFLTNATTTVSSRIRSSINSLLPPSRSPDRKYDLLLYLACAQLCNVDIIGITWMDAQGMLGSGGQANVAQTRASIDVVFAFKRHQYPVRPSIFNNKYEIAKDHAFREICSEIMVLGHETIHSHPHIVQLYALNWEIVDVEKWPPPKETDIWPVLILEKAPHGDLGHFLRSEAGRKTDRRTRLHMCAGVASALAAVHKIGIIHGDIKPENSLVFEGPLVKLSDFGFSALVSNESGSLAGTTPWKAPELGRLNPRDSGAIKLTDLYSFGMLCLWILFREELAIKGRRASLTSAEPDKEDLELLKQCNTSSESCNTMQNLAQSLVAKLPEEEPKNLLMELLTRLLSVEPKSRTCVPETWQDFEMIAESLRGGTTVHHDVSEDSSPPEPERTIAEFPTAKDFQVHRSLQSLCQSDIRVRRHIFQCLLSEYETARDEEEKSMAAVQLAFCKKVGFGDVKDDIIAEDYRKDGHIDSAHLQKMIDETRAVQKKFNPDLQNIYETGIIQPIHSETDIHRVKEPLMVQKACEEEIKQMEEVLGKTHPAVLNLKWSLSAMMSKRDDPTPLLWLLKHMVDDLEADPNYGPTHKDTLIAKAFFSLSLPRLAEPQTAEIVVEYCKKTYNTLAHNNLKDHAVTMTLCGTISNILNNLRRTKESMDFLNIVTEGTSRIFGPAHPNTLIALDQKTDALILTGDMNAALANAKDISSRMSGLVDSDEGIHMGLRNKHETILIMMGKFDDVIGLVEEDRKDMEGMFPPIQNDILMMSVHAYLRKSRFDDAIDCAQKAVQLTRGIPWPIPMKSAVQDESGYDLNLSKELSNLIGSDGITPGDGGNDNDSYETDMNLFPKNPNLMAAELAVVMAQHAKAYTLEGTEKQSDATRLNKEAGDSLEKLLQAVDMKLNSGDSRKPHPVVAYKAGEADARSRSAILRATDQGLLLLVEILASLGAQNSDDGLHYTKVLEIARKKEASFSSTTAILEEHYSLCAVIPPPPSSDASPPLRFKDATAIAAWMTGPWTGLFLYQSVVPRKDKTGRKIMELQATVATTQSENKDCAWDVDLQGTSMDDMGTWIVKGRAYTSGRLVMWLYHEQGTEGAGWEYTGSTNEEQQALGGYWGCRGVDREAAGGTFVFFKF